MKKALPIVYSGFYDAPLAFLVKYSNRVYLFWRGYFNDEIDDYSPEYEVFITKLSSIENINVDWENLWKQGIDSNFVGKIHINNVIFDSTHRKFIGVDTFKELFNKTN